MEKILKNIINETMEREYTNLESRFIAALGKNEKLKKEYDLYNLKTNKIKEKLNDVLPEEYHSLLEEFEDNLSVISLIENMISHKEGIITGVTELNYLNEVGTEIHFI